MLVVSSSSLALGFPFQKFITNIKIWNLERRWFSGYLLNCIPWEFHLVSHAIQKQPIRQESAPWASILWYRPSVCLSESASELGSVLGPVNKNNCEGLYEIITTLILVLSLDSFKMCQYNTFCLAVFKALLPCCEDHIYLWEEQNDQLITYKKAPDLMNTFCNLDQYRKPWLKFQYEKKKVPSRSSRGGIKWNQHHVWSMRVSVPNQRYCGRMMKQGERRNLQPPNLV